MGEIQRLDKVLGNLGYGTRKEIKKLVKEGAIEVDGNAADDPGMHVDPETQEILVAGQDIGYKKYIYIMLNKPDGVVSATEDDRDKTVVDILPDEYTRFKPAPVGRLRRTKRPCVYSNCRKRGSPSRHLRNLFPKGCASPWPNRSWSVALGHSHDASLPTVR